MAIQLRRGNEADLDISQLRPGEVAVCLDTGKIIVKLTGGNYLTLTDTDAIQEIVAGKAAASHTHGQSDVTGLVDALAGKAAASHTHVKSDVTDLTNVKPDWNAASGSDAEILNKPTIPSYSNATASAAGLMSAADKTKLDAINIGQMVYIDENTANITLSSPRTLSESLSNYKIIEVRALQFEEIVSNTLYQTWGWVRLIKSSAGTFSAVPVMHFISNGGSLVMKGYEIGISSSNPNQLVLLRDTAGTGLWTNAIVGYK